MSTDTIDTRPTARLKQRWDDLTPTQRRLLVAAAAVDAAARSAALIDLSRRAADEVRGPKWLWAAALPVVTSVGILPAAYFLLGRH